MPEATSVFVGGGTPSLVPAAGLVSVLEAIPTRAGAEVTVECNPDTVTDDLVATYVAGGVNRLSVGVQSMVDHVLIALGRTHDPANVRRSVEIARRNGIETFNLDLIYGGAGESLDDWRRTLDDALALDPPHVSAYALTVEPARRSPPIPTAIRSTTTRPTSTSPPPPRGRPRASSGTRSPTGPGPGHRCRHNLLYWEQGDYLGFGCAAHSHHAGRRWWNLRTPERYVAAVEDEAPRKLRARPSMPRPGGERLQLALRTAAGVPLDSLDADGRRGRRSRDPRGDRWVLTPEGRLLANEVAMRLVVTAARIADPGR